MRQASILTANAPTTEKPAARNNFPRRLVRAFLSRPYLSCRLSNQRRIQGWQWLGVKLEGEVYISPEARLTCFLDRIRIGDGSLIGDKVELYAWEKIELGRRVLLSQGAKLLTGTHDHQSADFEGVGKPIRIGDYAWIGAYALLLPGINIGEGAVIGAGAVVTREVPPYAVAAGNPARIIGERKRLDFKYIPAKFP
jgi:acetyltransferase-like isoleucine patch superfamily enzyme